MALNTTPPSERRLRQAELGRFNKEYEKLQHDWLLTIVRHQEKLPHDHHRRAVVAVEKLERSTRQLSETSHVALETEVIGKQILSDLHAQRETIQRARSNLRQVEADLDTSSRTLTSMDTLYNRFSAWWSSLQS